MQRQSIEVCFKNPAHNFKTEINGTRETVTAYYLGHSWNIEPYQEPEIETFEKCINVRFFMNGMICNELRQCELGELFWQEMMKAKKEISEDEFLALVNINELPILDDGETWQDYKSYAGEDMKFYNSDRACFFQCAGFEFIWSKEAN